MKKLFLLILYIFLFNPCFSEVLIWVDSNPVDVGEMFNLHIEAKNIDDLEEPIINLINGIQLLNRSKQEKTSIGNNQINRSVKWTYVMLAEYSGNFKIPSFKVGNEFTKPFTLRVKEKQESKKNEIVKLKVDILPRVVFPQQQILIRLSIIRNGMQLVNESITPLEIEGAKVEKIKEESFQKVENGKKKLITEILFVVFPKKSGKLIIPQINYQGDEISGINLGSIFQKFGSYSKNRGRRIFNKSESHSINVKNIPKKINGWWLPVNNLELKEKWEPDNIKNFILGEPITRTVYITVEGAYADQIPELRINYPIEIKNYSDKPILKNEKTEKGLKGLRIEKYALIPNKLGEIKLPEISVDWWDVSKNEIRKSIIPSKIIEVISNQSIKNNEKNNFNISNDFNDIIKEDSINLNNDEILKTVFLWQNLTIIMAILWFFTILYWYLKKRFNKKLTNLEENKSKDNSVESLKHATQKLKKAIDSESPSFLKDELLNWGKIYWKNDPPKGIEQIGERIPEIKKGIDSLNSILYGDNVSKSILSDFKKELFEFNYITSKNKKTKKKHLELIYPGKND